MNKSICGAFFIAAVAGSSLLAAGVNQVRAESKTVQLVITVMAPACVINNNKPVVVNFGNVEIGKIDGVNYQRQKLDYTLDCGSGSKSLKLRLSGTASDFDSEMLSTSDKNLAIGLYRDTTRLSLNAWSGFNMPGSPPAIFVVPARKSGSAVTPGGFQASALLEVDYL